MSVLFMSPLSAPPRSRHRVWMGQFLVNFNIMSVSHPYIHQIMIIIPHL